MWQTCALHRGVGPAATISQATDLVDLDEIDLPTRSGRLLRHQSVRIVQ
jgi:hypothetical protein